MPPLPNPAHQAPFAAFHKDGRVRVAQAVVPNCDVIAACSSKGFSCSGSQWTLFLFEDTVLLTVPRKREIETLGNFLRSQITKTSRSFRNTANSFNRAVQVLCRCSSPLPVPHALTALVPMRAGPLEQHRSRCRLVEYQSGAHLQICWVNGPHNTANSMAAG